MKILYVITGLGMGGAETITIDVAQKMLERGHEVAVLYLTGDNLQQHRIKLQMEIIGLHMKKSPIGFLRALKQARIYVNMFSPNVVHAQMFHANLFCRILRLFTRMPFLICTEHNRNIEGAIRMKLYRLTDCLSDMNTNVSEEATNYFISKKSFNKEKSKTIYNGVDLSKFIKDDNVRKAIRKEYGILEEDFLFINVGRLTKAKNQETLVKAFFQLKNKCLHVKLLIVGKGPEEEKLKKIVSSFSLKSDCIFTGIQNNIVDYYNAADCFVLSSLWEGFPMVLIEAMATELPIITTECGREAVSDNNYIVSAENSFLLSEKMESIYNMNLSDRIQLGISNRNHVKRFDINIICSQWEDIYSGKI